MNTCYFCPADKALIWIGRHRYCAHHASTLDWRAEIEADLRMTRSPIKAR